MMLELDIDHSAFDASLAPRHVSHKDGDKRKEAEEVEVPRRKKMTFESARCYCIRDFVHDIIVVQFMRTEPCSSLDSQNPEQAIQFFMVYA